MFILSIVILAGLAIYIFIAKYTYKILKKEHPDKKYISKVVLAIFILIPTYDIIITNILAGYYCLTRSSTYINKKIEYPISIYWEDNVYPGFSKEDRELMIINYLDGKHLKTMALNGDDGNIYVYHLDRPFWGEFEKKYKENLKKYPPKQDKFKGHSFDVYKAYANEIIKTQKIFSKDTMPKTNYTVTFNEVKLNSFASKFLYSDETKVIENNTSKTIAYNQRYMRFFYNIMPDVALGNIYYVEGSMCGNSYFWFDYHVFEFKGVTVRNKHQLDLNNYLYKKYIKGEN